MDNFMHVPLNLPDVRGLSTQRTEQGHWLIRVESTLEGTQCRRCGREIRDLHGWDAAVRLRPPRPAPRRRTCVARADYPRVRRW